MILQQCRVSCCFFKNNVTIYDCFGSLTLPAASILYQLLFNALTLQAVFFTEYLSLKFHLEPKRCVILTPCNNLIFSSLSGDLERIRLSLQESEAEKQAMRDRINDLVQSQQHLEQKATSLQLTVSRLYLMSCSSCRNLEVV